MIRVLIADDHVVVAEGLRHLLETYGDIEVIGSVENGRAAITRSLESQPDVVVMDSTMPEMNGIEATQVIRARSPATRILVLSVNSDPMCIARALRAGASGYVPKSFAGREVVDAIRAVSQGRRYIPAPLMEEVLEQLASESPVENPLAVLSTRERQVMRMIAEGKSVADIGQSLSLSPRTIETYRARVMEKLGVHDVPGLVKLAILHGLIALG
jgi:DNA-binding NarL/FixJ family response regulator